jgi:hypothetical protein
MLQMILIGFKVLLTHELCHAYLQNGYKKGEMWDTSTIVFEAVADILTERFLGKDFFNEHGGDGYDLFVKIVRTLCEHSKGQLEEVDFINACNSKKSLNELHSKLNLAYSDKLACKDVLEYIEAKFNIMSHSHDSWNRDSANKQYQKFIESLKH